MIDYKVQIAQIIAKQEIGLTAEEIAEMIEVPTDPKNGDFAFPCFRLAKTMRKAPQMIAADVASSIENAVSYTHLLVVKSKYKDLKDNIDKGRLHKVLDELFKRNIKRGTITISSDGYASFTPEL